MKALRFFIFGSVCLALVTYDFGLRNSIGNATIGDTSGRDREKYMALREVFIKQYGEENLYQISNFYGTMGVSILLGFVAILLFSFAFSSLNNSPNSSKIKKTILTLFIIITTSITSLNLWTIL